jgi:hypothetical protein
MATQRRNIAASMYPARRARMPVAMASAAQIKQRPTKLAKKNRPGIQVGMRVEMKKRI